MTCYGGNILLLGGFSKFFYEIVLFAFYSYRTASCGMKPTAQSWKPDESDYFSAIHGVCTSEPVDFSSGGAS
jgi:hypothetical protein